jgi:hypothetical protein
LEDNSPTSCVLVLLMVIDVAGVLVELVCLFGDVSTSHNRVGYNMISIRTLSLLTYSIDIALYALGSTA